MNNIKTTIISVVASIVIVVAGLAVYHPSNTIVQESAPVQETVKGTIPEFSSPYIAINGVTQWYYSEQMKTATTTLCSFQAPTGTSTLEYLAWDINQGTSTSALIDIGTSVNPSGATALITGGSSVGSNAKGSLLYSTNGTSTNLTSFNSNPTSNLVQYANVITEGAGQAGYTYGGQCYAVFDSY